MLKIRTFLLLACLWALPFAASAEDLPVSMIVTGSLAQSSDGKVAPAEGDSITLVDVNTSKTEATAAYDGSGMYALAISKPPSYNSSQLSVRLVHAGITYKLLNAATSSDALVVFNGSFFPVQLTLNLVASSTVLSSTGTTTDGTSTDGTGTTPAPPAALTGDINDDKKVDEKDILLLKQGISGQVPTSSKMDVNGDMVINTRDLIDLIRLVRTQANAALKPASIIPVKASIIPGR